MTENTDPNDSDCTDSTDCGFEAYLPSNILDDFDPLVTVPRPPCDACDTNRHDGLIEVSFGNDTFNVCDNCRMNLIDDIKRHDWWDRLTEAHYDRAADFLRSRDEVWCVKDHGYPGGEMWVHTPYCNAAVVNDVCDHFGFAIRWFQIVEPTEGEFECVHDHGPCLEINLDFAGRRGDPIPLVHDIIEDVQYYDADYLKADDRLFEEKDDCC